MEGLTKLPFRFFDYAARVAVVLYIVLLAILVTQAFIPLNSLATNIFYGDSIIFAYILAWGLAFCSRDCQRYFPDPLQLWPCIFRIRI